MGAIYPATGESISRIITEVVAQTTGDLLYIFWAGHGVIDMIDKLFHI